VGDASKIIRARNSHAKQVVRLQRKSLRATVKRISEQRFPKDFQYLAALYIASILYTKAVLLTDYLPILNY
jgi:hypothetical protein